MKAAADRLSGRLLQVSGLIGLVRVLDREYGAEAPAVTDFLKRNGHDLELRAVRDARPVNRNQRRRLVGVVTRDKNLKTRRVEVERYVQHLKYGKYVKRRTVCYAHDERDASHLGDVVEIEECHPLSRTKRWRLVRIVHVAPSRTLSKLEGGVAGITPP